MSTAEKFSLACPGCGHQVGVSRAHIGKKGRCPACQTVFPITEPVAAPFAATPDLAPLGAAPLGAAPVVAASAPAWNADPFGAPPVQNSPFGQPTGLSSLPPVAAAPPADEYGLAPVPASTSASPFGANPYQTPGTGSYSSPVPTPQRSFSESGGGTLLAGIGMMVGAVVWFVGGLMFDYIFFYPPILFIFGLIAFFKGLIAMASGK